MSGCRIELVSAQKFSHLQTEHNIHILKQNSYYPWQANSIVRLQDQAFTEGAYDCNDGGIQNGKRVTLFHLRPDTSIKKPEKVRIRKILAEDSVELQKKGSVRGLIAGGMIESEDSVELQHMLQKTMKRSGVKSISKIWGRKNKQVEGPTNVMYRADKNTWYINAQLSEEKNKDILTMKDLYRAFDTVELARSDTLVTAEGTYSASSVSPNIFQLLVAKLFNTNSTPTDCKRDSLLNPTHCGVPFPHRGQFGINAMA